MTRLDRFIMKHSRIVLILVILTLPFWCLRALAINDCEALRKRWRVLQEKWRKRYGQRWNDCSR